MARRRAAARRAAWDAAHPTHPALPASVSVSRDRDALVVYEIERGGRRSFALVVAFALVAVLACTTVLTALRTRAAADVGVALSLTSLALVLWAGFLGVDRTRVRVVAGVLVVHRDDTEHRFDLRQPHVGVAVTGDPRTRKWRARISAPAHDDVVLTRSHVDPDGFAAVVALYRPAPVGPAGSAE